MWVATIFSCAAFFMFMKESSYWLIIKISQTSQQIDLTIQHRCTVYIYVFRGLKQILDVCSLIEINSATKTNKQKKGICAVNALLSAAKISPVNFCCYRKWIMPCVFPTVTSCVHRLMGNRHSSHIPPFCLWMSGLQENITPSLFHTAKISLITRLIHHESRLLKKG